MRFEIFLIFAVPIIAAEFQCNLVPPTLWCDSSELAQRCGFKKYCDDYLAAAWNRKLKLTLLYEALCPGCQTMITGVLYPQIYRDFKDYVDIELVPFGNARIENGTIICQHGDDECTINRFESCVIDSMKGSNAALPYIYCLEQQLEAAVPFKKAVLKCYRKLGVPKAIQNSISTCVKNGTGDRLQLEAAKRTADIYPDKHDHVPWMLFNNASLSRAQVLQDSLPSAICEWYSGDRLPPQCKRMKAVIMRKYLIPGY